LGATGLVGPTKMGDQPNEVVVLAWILIREGGDSCLLTVFTFLLNEDIKDEQKKFGKKFGLLVGTVQDSSLIGLNPLLVVDVLGSSMFVVVGEFLRGEAITIVLQDFELV
jgi:hypothetical protein